MLGWMSCLRHFVTLEGVSSNYTMFPTGRCCSALLDQFVAFSNLCWLPAITIFVRIPKERKSTGLWDCARFYSESLSPFLSKSVST